MQQFQPALQPQHGQVDSFNNQFNLPPSEQIPIEPVKIDSVVNAGVFSYGLLAVCPIRSDDHTELKTSNLLVHSAHHGAQSHCPVMQLTASQLMLDYQVSQLRLSSGGLIITHKLNSSSVQANSIHDLRIESRNEQLKLISEKAIAVEAINGQVRASGHSGVVLHSIRNGTLVLDSAKVQMTHFKQYHHHHQLMHQRNRYHDQDQQQTDKKKKVEPIAYQLCICGDGNMFIADAHMCEVDLSIWAN